jgi:HK97 family phage prohead protease
MPLPKPRKDETQDEFMARCMHEAYGPDAPSDRTQEQAVAMCAQTWRDRNKPDKADDGAAATDVGKMNRAYSLLSIKRVNEDARIITGMATTPAPDRMGDIVEPTGAKFNLPMPFLWQHDVTNPIGKVTAAKVTKAGIEIIAEIAKGVSDEIDRAWSLIKAGLVTGLSIGFRIVDAEPIDKKDPFGGMRILAYNLLELSAVTLPANAEATIATVKSLDAALLAAPGRKASGVDRKTLPGASGSSQPRKPAEGIKMKSFTEQITALEAKRAASAARMEAVMTKSLEEDRTTDAAEQEEFDTLSSQVDAIDKDLVRLRKLENGKAANATAVKAATSHQGAAMRGALMISTRQPELPVGILGTQALKVFMCAKMDGRPMENVAAEMYGQESSVYALVTKAAVVAGTTITGNWAANLVGTETGLFADFIEFLRPRIILGRFGTGNIPALRSVQFYVPLITQTSGGAGYWVGEAKAKPLTSFNFSRTHLSPLKVANICVLTMENIRFSNPKSDTIVRDQLAQALIERLDFDFITPAKTAVAGISPASITNGAPAIASAAGTDADSVRLDIRSLWAKFNSYNNPPQTGVWVMPSNVAVSLASMVNPLGQQAFPDMNIMGGTLFGMPVIASDHCPATNVVLVNASDIYLADDGGFTIDASQEASLEMSDAPTGDAGTPTAASLVSMFQTNSVALRAERVINWARRRTGSVAYLTGVDWGGAVNTV